jgi:hypothetical protein
MTEIREKIREVLEKAQCNPDMTIWAEKDILAIIKESLPEKRKCYMQSVSQQEKVDGYNACIEEMERKLEGNNEEN